LFSANINNSMTIKICGIYKIKNIINGKCYIGQSIDIHNRIRKHIIELKNNKHMNQYLQYSWNKYGKSNFLFEIIETCLPEELFFKEGYWINELKTLNKNFGYNIEIVDPNLGKKVCSDETKDKISKSLSGRIPWNIGIKPSQETREKMSKSSKGRIFSEEHRKNLSISGKNRIVSEETRKKISNSKIGISSGLKGKKHTEETKLKISNALKGKKMTIDAREKLSKSLKGKNTWKKNSILSEETKLKISKSLLGRKHTEEAKRKMSISQKENPPMLGKTHSKETKTKISKNQEKTFSLLAPNGEVITFTNMKLFCIENNLDDGSLNKVFHGIRKKHKGYMRIINL
jgi:group I intron endonuclease